MTWSDFSFKRCFAENALKGDVGGWVEEASAVPESWGGWDLGGSCGGVESGSSEYIVKQIQQGLRMGWMWNCVKNEWEISLDNEKLCQEWIQP